MNDGICSIGGCESKAHSRGWCSSHYHRFNRYGDPEHPVKERKRGAVCSLPDCSKRHMGAGYCQLHYNRFVSTGSPIRPCRTCGKDCDGRQVFCSPACRSTCAQPGCSKPCRTRGLCSGHYDDLYDMERTGAPRAYRWATEKRCLVCGKTEWQGKGRKVCSPRCQQLYFRAGNSVPVMMAECNRCGVVIDLSETGKSGRKKRADVLLCAACRKAKSTRHKMSVTELFNRDGNTCGICSEPIDMTLVFPHLFRASVDHIIPFAHGGTHEPENLQLACLWCNYVKSDRVGFVI